MYYHSRRVSPLLRPCIQMVVAHVIYKQNIIQLKCSLRKNECESRLKVALIYRFIQVKHLTTNYAEVIK